MRMMSTSTIPFDHAEAQREGWDVFRCLPDAQGRSQYQLQHLDAPENGKPVFSDNKEAWEHVVTRARAGSALHRAALDAVDDTERMLIEAACGAW